MPTLLPNPTKCETDSNTTTELTSDPEEKSEMEIPSFIAPSPLTPRFLNNRLRLTLRPPAPSKTPPNRPVAVLDARPRPGVDFHGIPNPRNGEPLLLSDLRERLIRQEETIIFSLIERAQFNRNPILYRPGEFDLPPESRGLSFVQFFLYELEKVHSKVRRYTSPDEHPFVPKELLPSPILGNLKYPQTLVDNDINVNAKIEEVYVGSILDGICEQGDDQNYGSAATCDVTCLQALSKRIHYGKFIAEAKCQENHGKYKELAMRGDRDGITRELSNLKVEEILLKRVENKARSYGSDISGEGCRDVFKVEPRNIAEMYRELIIPLTKEVEVDYIMHRYGHG